MRLGVVVLPELAWPEARSVWRDVEAMGFAHAWTYDHLAWRDLRDGPWFGAVPFLAAAATVTSTLRLGPLVSSPNFRHPVAYAREVVSLDDISEGRINLGIGAGGQGWDASVLGEEPWSPGERVERYGEFVEVLDRLLVEGSLSFRGRYYSASEARALPGCRQRPRVPFVLAGSGPRAMATVARHGQVWVTTGPRGTGELVSPVEGAGAVVQQGRKLDEACHRMGRNASEIDRMVLLGPTLGQGLSSPQAFADTLGAYESAGVTDVVVHWPRPAEPYAGRRSDFEKAVLPVLGS